MSWDGLRKPGGNPFNRVPMPGWIVGLARPDAKDSPSPQSPPLDPVDAAPNMAGTGPCFRVSWTKSDEVRQALENAATAMIARMISARTGLTMPRERFGLPVQETEKPCALQAGAERQS